MSDDEQILFDDEERPRRDSPQGMEWGKLCGPYSSAHTSQREPGLRVIIRKTLSRMVELKGGKDDH